MSTPTEELAALARKTIDDVKELAASVTVAVGQLEKIREDYKNGLWSRFTQLVKIIFPVIVFILGIIFANHIPCGTDINVAGLEISRNCSIDHHK